jgi:hypothetical protein
MGVVLFVTTMRNERLVALFVDYNVFARRERKLSNFQNVYGAGVPWFPLRH